MIQVKLIENVFTPAQYGELRFPHLLSLILACLLIPSAALAQHEHAAGSKSVCADSGFGNTHHSVKTTSPEAQRMFDQGLALSYYGFNHNEAEKCFQLAAQLDPKMAMAYWGIALVVGPNYNLPIDAEREKQAYEAIQKAGQLAANGPAVERDYIAALAKRYTDQPTEDYHALDVTYNAAMREAVEKISRRPGCRHAVRGKRHEPASLEAVETRWHGGGGGRRVVATLESVLRRDRITWAPTISISTRWRRRTMPTGRCRRPSGWRLWRPKSGHLVHMPGSHLHPHR